MNIFQFNKVLYMGNVNKDFYIFCLKRNIKIVKYLFINLFYYIVSILFSSKQHLYIQKKYKYLRDVKNLNKVISEFYKNNKKLDVVEMERAMKYLEGTHNFKSFTKTDEEKDDYVRTISQTNLIRDAKDINKITLVFVGTGFLRYMVRNIVGTLIMVGEGKIKSEDVIDILKKEDRRSAGKTANGEGLYLKNVFY